MLIHLVQGFPTLPIGIICWWPLLLALTSFDTVLTSSFPLTDTAKKSFKYISNPRLVWHLLCHGCYTWAHMHIFRCSACSQSSLFSKWSHFRLQSNSKLPAAATIASHITQPSFTFLFQGKNWSLQIIYICSDRRLHTEVHVAFPLFFSQGMSRLLTNFLGIELIMWARENSLKSIFRMMGKASL